MNLHVFEQWEDQEDERLEGFLQNVTHGICIVVALLAVATVVIQVRKAMGR